jgi:hypothetical protein
MNDQEKYASFYVKHKDKLMPLIEASIQEPIPVGTTHEALIKVYIGLLKNPDFLASVDNAMRQYENAVDPISAIAEGVGSIFSSVGGVIKSRQEGENILAQSEAQSDAAMYELILNKQGQDNTGKILIFSGIAVVVVGAIITVIILKRKKS